MTVEVGIIVGNVSAFDMNALDSRIRELVAYARERDGEDRTTLFRSLVDMFLTGKAPVKEPTRAQLLDVIEALIPHVEAESRRTVSEILAGMAKPPMDLVRRLVRDRAALMEDLLKNAPFDEDEIIEVIGQTGREHHQILASRSDLSANVWIALARAAPSAPPFEGRSTLALWRDDLGSNASGVETQHTEDTEQEDYTEEVEPQRAVMGGGGTIVASASDVTSFAATVTQLRPDRPSGLSAVRDDKKAASLRILRTDEDLIAERMNDRTPPPETRMVHGNGVDDGQDAHKLTRAGMDGVEARPSLEADDSGMAAPIDEPRYLRDPGPGGWAWRSDRDGFIKLVSPFAARMFGGQDKLVGMAMLDMLGLNTKLDHPVSRAFQRRSTIHDAPINLPHLGEHHQYWTLEAAPVFSPNNGVFEGFEGILTPVVAARNEEVKESPSYHQPLFLDEEERPQAAARSRMQAPASFADKPSVLQSSLEGGQHEEAPEETGRDRHPIAEMINSTAAAMVREAVANALTPLSPAEEETRYGAPSDGQAADIASEPNDTAPQSDELIATLQLLEEALARLSEAGEKGAVAQVRLQSEIASACARTLKGLLTK